MHLGLSLSGGGARGISHIGILKAFDEYGIKFSMLTGTSAGAIVGAFYCAGYSPDEIIDIIKSVKLYKYIRPAISKSGLLKMGTTKAIYEKYLPPKFEDLSIPFVIAATNLRQGTNTFFSHGQLIEPVMASSAVPVVFDPVKIENELYIDGGILNNLPVEPLIGHVDKIVGINCNPIGEQVETGNMKSLLERSLLMAINVNSYNKKGQCDLFLEAEGLKGFGAMEFAKAQQLFDIGYEYGKTVADKVLLL